MDRPYSKLAGNKLTRLALMSQDARVVTVAIEEMEQRASMPKETLEFANAHLLALIARDQAMADVRYFKEIFPKLEQRVRDLESRGGSPTVN